MSAWLSFIGGYAKGANEEIDKQREKEDKYIQDRMKLAASTRLEKQKEAEKQRQELKDADLSLSINEDYKTAPTAVKMAMLSSPELREIYSTRKKADPTTTVMDIVNTNPQIDELAKKYPTIGAWQESFQAKPNAVGEQTMEAFKNPKRAFGATVGSTEEDLRQNAARFNMTAEEGAGWANGGQDLPSTNLGATVKQSALAPNDIETQRKQMESQALAAQRQIETGTPEQKAEGEAVLKSLTAKARSLNVLARIIEGGEKAAKYTDEINTLTVRMANLDPKSPEYKAAYDYKVRLEKSHQVGKEKPDGPDAVKPATFAQLRTAANDAMITALRMGWGDSSLKGVSIEDVKQPDGTITKEVRFNKLDTDLQKQQYAAAKAAALNVLSPYIKNGAPTTEAARLLMTGLLSGEPAAPTVAPQRAPAAQQPPVAKPVTAAPTGPIPVTMLEISQYANDRKITPLQAREEITKKKDANGKPKYKVVP